MVMTSREWLPNSKTARVEVTIEWIEDSQEILEKNKKFSPYEMFSSQNDAESWGMLAALRWIDAGKPNTEALVTLH